MRIVVMASGSGSNFAAIYQAIIEGKIAAKFVSLIVDKNNAYAIERAQKLGADYHIVNYQDYDTKIAYETEILAILNELNPDLICLAGYMKIIGDTLLNKYEGKIINIHPSMLPKYPGRTALSDALEAGETEIGITTHYVDAGVDTGKIIMQDQFTIDDMNREQIEAKLHKLEHKLYIKTINKIIGE